MKALAAMVGVGALACGHGAADPTDAQVDALIDAPAEVRCVRVVAAGATRTAVREIAVSAASPAARVVLTGLPSGHVIFAATAHDGSCADPATWVAEGVEQDLVPGSRSAVTLVFHPNGALLLTVRFAGASTVPAGVACLVIGVEGAVRSVLHRIPISPVSALQWSLDELPVGSVFLTAHAFAESCAAPATLVWSSGAQPATLAGGAFTPVTLDLQAR